MEPGRQPVSVAGKWTRPTLLGGCGGENGKVRKSTLFRCLCLEMTYVISVHSSLARGRHTARLHFSGAGKGSLSQASDGKEYACNVGDLGSVPGLGRSPGEGNGYPLQYSCLENSTDSGPQSVESQRSGRRWVTNTFAFTFYARK